MAPVINSRRTLEEINERVDAALGRYELMEEQDPQKYADLRREDQAEATYGDLVEAGRARIDIVLVAMADIGRERESLLSDLRAKLESERHSAEQSEKEGRHEMLGDEDATDGAALIERIDALEALQRRISTSGEALLERLRASQSLELTEKLQNEVTEKEARISELEEEAVTISTQLEETTVALQQRTSELDELKAKMRAAADKAAAERNKAKEAAEKALKERMEAQMAELESTRVELRVAQEALAKSNGERDALAQKLAASEAAIKRLSEEGACTVIFSGAEAPEPGTEDPYIDHTTGLTSLVESIVSQLEGSASPDCRASLSELFNGRIVSAQAAHEAEVYRETTRVVEELAAQMPSIDEATQMTRPGSSTEGRSGDLPPPLSPPVETCRQWRATDSSLSLSPLSPPASTYAAL